MKRIGLATLLIGLALNSCNNLETKTNNHDRGEASAHINNINPLYNLVNDENLQNQVPKIYSLRPVNSVIGKINETPRTPTPDYITPTAIASPIETPEPTNIPTPTHTPVTHCEFVTPSPLPTPTPYQSPSPNTICDFPTGVSRGECEGRLGDYPHPFIDDRDFVIVYGHDRDLYSVRDITSAFNSCPRILRDTEIENLQNYPHHIISVGCLNTVTTRAIGFNNDAGTCDLRPGDAKIRIDFLDNDREIMLVYGYSFNETRRASGLLKDYEKLRLILNMSGKSCDYTVNVSGTDSTWRCTTE